MSVDITPDRAVNLSFKDEFLSSLDQKIGLMGSLMVGVGLIGSITGGIILDLSKKYKLVISLVYISALVVLVLFTFMISFGNLYLDFFFISALGIVNTNCYVTIVITNSFAPS